MTNCFFVLFNGEINAKVCFRGEGERFHLPNVRKKTRKRGYSDCVKIFLQSSSNRFQIQKLFTSQFIVYAFVGFLHSYSVSIRQIHARFTHPRRRKMRISVQKSFMVFDKPLNSRLCISDFISATIGLILSRRFLCLKFAKWTARVTWL